MAKLTRIGIIELIDLPGNDAANIPAKIDTGADSSSVWASNISEKNRQLSFTLFDKSSPFYSGKTLKFDDYKVIKVKNSFGHTELRFKVLLSVLIAGKKVKAQFTLANREKNKYPILIGRRTISGKFLVDVTKSARGERNVLMLTIKPSDVTEKFALAVQAKSRQLNITYKAYQEFIFETGEGHNKIYMKSGQDAASFDLVHFKTFEGLADIAASLASYLGRRNVAFIDTAVRNFSGSSKLYQYVLLSDNNIICPKSIFMLPPVLESSYNYLATQLKKPFVLKDIHGQKGNYNYLISNETVFKRACQAADKAGILLIAQENIENDADYRVLVFGGQIGLVIKRTRSNSQKSHLNNTSKGATASLVQPDDLPPEVQDMCVNAARKLGRQVAGVDIVEDKNTNLWYCLEVNDGPQLATGSYREEKQVAFKDYLERKLKN